jgi:hypothetical protein
MARIYQETGVEPSQQPLFHPAHLEANQPVFTSVSSTAPPTTIPLATTSSLASVKTEPVVEDAYPMKVLDAVWSYSALLFLIHSCTGRPGRRRRLCRLCLISYGLNGRLIVVVGLSCALTPNTHQRKQNHLLYIMHASSAKHIAPQFLASGGHNGVKLSTSTSCGALALTGVVLANQILQ